jgi:parallel beta-helix repeat protein
MVSGPHVRSVFFVALALALLAVPAVAAAVDRLVNPDDTCAPSVLPQHDTIQEAVDEAAAGEEIGVCPGTYDESVAIGTADLSLVAIGHVVLTGGVPCLNIIAPGARVRGFEITGCDGALRLVADDAVIENNIFHGNTVAMTVGGSSNLIRNNLVRDNTDAGIVIAGMSPGTVVHNNTVRRNANVGISVPAGGDPADPDHPLVVTKNLVQYNGFGIDAAFANDTVISFNSVAFNAIGIMLTDVTSFLVTRNNASRSVAGPDCVWDGLNAASVTFKANSCRTEVPPGAWD